RPVFHRAVLWNDAISSSSPGGVTKAYARGFVREGGQCFLGEALSLRRAGALWQLTSVKGAVEAPLVVVAMGPWTPDLLRPLGLRFPLAVIRGYHRHFRPIGNAGLARPVLDLEKGFVITP